MPLWEEHRQSLIVLGTFLGLLFLSWLFFLRGYADEAVTARKTYEKKIAEEREKLCPEAGQKVDILQIAYEKANRELDKSIADLGEKLRFRFDEPLIPPEKKRRRRLFVRDQYKILEDYVLREASQRDIALREDGPALGFEMRAELDETLETDLMWLQQLAVLRRTFDTLMRVYEENDPRRGVRMKHLKAIRYLRPGAPVRTGTDTERFLMEYPVEMELLVSLRGLMLLLDLCSRPETFHVVRGLEVTSTPAARLTEPRRRRVTPERGEKWLDRYYAVRLTFASLSLVDEAQIEAEKKPKEQKKRPTVIPH